MSRMYTFFLKTCGNIKVVFYKQSNKKERKHKLAKDKITVTAVEQQQVLF